MDRNANIATCVCLCVCVRACVRASVRACVCARARARAQAYVRGGKGVGYQIRAVLTLYDCKLCVREEGGLGIKSVQY